MSAKGRKPSNCAAVIWFHPSEHEQIQKSRRDDSAKQREFVSAKGRKPSNCAAVIWFHPSEHEQIQKSRRDNSAQQREFVSVKEGV